MFVLLCKLPYCFSRFENVDRTLYSHSSTVSTSALAFSIQSLTNKVGHHNILPLPRRPHLLPHRPPTHPRRPQQRQIQTRHRPLLPSPPTTLTLFPYRPSSNTNMARHNQQMANPHQPPPLPIHHHPLQLLLLRAPHPRRRRRGTAVRRR